MRLQHPLGVAWHDGMLYIADTYNHKIKRLDPATAECRTLLGDGVARPSRRRGRRARASASRAACASRGGRLYVADTNNHAVRVADLATGRVVTLELLGLAAP